MRFSVNRAEFSAAMESISGALDKSSSFMPILRGVMLRADGSQNVTLRATNLALAGQSSVAVDVKEPGAVVINGSTLSDFARVAVGEALEITVAKAWATAVCGKSKLRLATMDMEGYPEALAVPTDANLSIPAEWLRGALRAALPIAERNEDSVGGKEWERCISLEAGREYFRVVAYDSKRTLVARKDGGFSPFSALISRAGCAELVKLIGEGEVAISQDQAWTYFDLGPVHLASRSVTGKMPDVSSAIARLKFSGYTALVDNQEMRGLLGRAAAMSDLYGKFKSITVSCGDAISIVADEEQSVGSYEESISVDQYSGEPLTFRCNPAYFGEWFKGATSGKSLMSIEAIAAGCQVKLTPELQADGEHVQYVFASKHR